MSVSDLENADIIVIEADGKVDTEHGYGFLIEKRLAEFKVNSALVSLVDNAEILEQLPPKPLILSGGMTEVTSDVEWVVKAREFFKKRIISNQNSGTKQHIPAFGICFGAQLIIESYSKGSVRYLEDPEIGITDVPLNASHSLFSGFGQKFNAYTFHYNQIQNQDVLILSSHKHKGHHFIQVFEIPNSSCFGVQFHPEFKYQEMITLLRTYKELIRDLGLDIEPIIRNLPKIPDISNIFKNYYDYCCNLT